MDNFKAKIVSSLEKVFLDQEPENHINTLGLTGLQNEVISFQVAYTCEALSTFFCAEDIKVTVQSPLLDNIQVRRVGHIAVGTPMTNENDDNYLFKKPRIAPDVLEKIDYNRIKISADCWFSLWVSIHTNKNTKAGIYPVAVLFYQEDGALLGKVELNIKIINVALPKQKLIHTEWFHSDCIADFYKLDVFSEEYWKITENFLKSAVDCGVNMILTPIVTPALDTGEGLERTTVQLVDICYDNGNYTFGFEKFRRWVALCKNCGIEYFEMAHLFTQWGAKAAPKIIVSIDGKLQNKFGWHTVATSEEYKEFLKCFLPSLIKELVALGISKQTYFHISDEPSEEHIETYLAAKNIVKEYLKDFPIIDALSSYEFYKRNIVEKPIPGSNSIQPFIDNDIKGLWTYYCMAQGKGVSNRFCAMPSSRNRILGTQLYKFNIEGFLHWGFNFYNTRNSVEHINPYYITDCDFSFPVGDAYLVYPGDNGDPVESIRYVVFREALQDLRAFQLLETFIGKEKVVQLIEEKAKSAITFDNFPNNQDYILELRNIINEKIETISITKD